MICDQLASSGSAQIADLCVRRLQISQSEALFDIQVVDADTHSYPNQAPLAVFSSTEHNKKKYSQACQDQRATFTPLCMSVDGTMGQQATAFLRTAK